MGISSHSSLALELARAQGAEVGRCIARLLDFELGSAGQGFISASVIAEHNIAKLSFGTSSPVSLSKDEALDSLFRGGLVVSAALAKWQTGISDLECSFDEAVNQRNAIESAQPRISFSPPEVIAIPQFEQARRVLSLYKRLAIVGPSSSGKTIVADAIRQHFGVSECLWIDLADPTVGLLGFIMAACNKSTSGQSILILDDLQSAPVLARSILHIIDGSGVFAEQAIRVVTVTWPDGLELIQPWFSDETVVRTNGSEACRRIVQAAHPTSHDSTHLVALANGDALIAELATDFLEHHHRVPTREELATECFDTMCRGQQLSREELESLWEIGCLGIFEIDARLDLVAPVSQAVLDGLLQKRMLRKKGEYVFFGHRSAARLLTYHLQSRLNDGTDRSPIRVAVRYLGRAGESQIKQTLDRLDLVAVANEEDQFGAAFLAHCWNSVKILVNYLGTLVREDPTWGDNVASAIFAAEALAQLGLEAEWSLIADYVRNRWILPDDQALPEHTPGDTAEADDFRAIYATMSEEDRLDPLAFTTKAEDIDIDRFHRTWVLGLLAGFEAKALVPDYSRIKELRRMVQDSQQVDGSFYPSRVPWVTARVCLGLAALGETVATSSVLRRASEWLRTRPPAGPFRFGSWRSGTGTWNTELQVTAMTLLALGRMGIDQSDRGVQSALAYLKDGRSEWYRPGKEIDCAQAIEAALILGDTWREFSTELRTLLEWVQDSRAWADARVLASVANDESSKVPAVASALISVIWETVKVELPLLFQGVVGGTLPSASHGDVRPELRLTLVRRLKHISDVIAQSIQERSSLGSRGVLPTVVAARLRELDVQDRECHELLTAVESSSNEAKMVDAGFITRVNVLGQSVLGGAWEVISIS